MSARSERERSKVLQEKHQAILSGLLKDEDNKYCVDCDAKGPRWASWNIGVFLCIRCAGIHRNLGVHVSKVKSVNLDSWTPEQISMVQEMGNSRARAVYEASLPDGYRRPQNDSALETFIRGKYEHKKWIAKEWIPPQRRAYQEQQKGEEKKERKSKIKTSISLEENNSLKTSLQRENQKTREKPSNQITEPLTVETTSTTMGDLLGLDTSADTTNSVSISSSGDLFGDFLGGPVFPAQPPQTDICNNDNSPAGASLFGELEQTRSTKDSIMALFSTQPIQQSHQFGVPGGMYMSQQQPQQYPAMMNQSSVLPPQPMINMSMGSMIPNQQFPPLVSQGMIGGQNMMNGMMAGQNSMTSTIYQMQQQQAHQQQAYVQQVQQQLAGISLNNTNLGSYNQQGTVAAGGEKQTGHTLSNNLWQ